MKAIPPVLLELARRYEASAAGRHGEGRIDVQPEAEELLAAAGCGEGERRELAERELRQARAAGVLALDPLHPREPDSIAKVRLSPACEQRFYDYIGKQSPSSRRAGWAALFREAAAWPVPERFAEPWAEFCAGRAGAALAWRGMKPFDREALAEGRELLALLPPLLAWEGRHLVRWASSVLCGRSKFLEQRQRTIEALLAEATAGQAPTYESLGILPVPPGVTFHGPLRLRIGDEWRDFRGLLGPTTLSGADVERITACEGEARRCLTIENATPFRSLAALHSGELLIHTSYPNTATLALLARLQTMAPAPEFWHFGDTDPSGFHILADLRERSGIAFHAFHMRFRPGAAHLPLTPRESALVADLIQRMPNEREALEAMRVSGGKGDFEQESLKPPRHARWPFY